MGAEEEEEEEEEEEVGAVATTVVVAGAERTTTEEGAERKLPPLGKILNGHQDPSNLNLRSRPAVDDELGRGDPPASRRARICRRGAREWRRVCYFTISTPPSLCHHSPPFVHL